MVCFFSAVQFLQLSCRKYSLDVSLFDFTVFQPDPLSEMKLTPKSAVCCWKFVACAESNIPPFSPGNTVSCLEKPWNSCLETVSLIPSLFEEQTEWKARVFVLCKPHKQKGSTIYWASYRVYLFYAELRLVPSLTHSLLKQTRCFSCDYLPALQGFCSGVFSYTRAQFPAVAAWLWVLLFSHH